MKRILLVNKNVQPSLAVTNRKTVIASTTFLLNLFFSAVLFFIAINSNAQNTTAEQQAAYDKTITERAAKITNTLELTDSNKYQKVLDAIKNQYFQLNTIQEQDKIATNNIKAQALSSEASAAAIKKKEEEKTSLLTQQHTKFLAQLKEQLTDEQVEKVKDGLTYRVLPITWAAYLDMLPRLTTEQKDKMYAWLVEARELAMDAESSDKKHAVFGKYKGRINNYLSAQGYDMKKEGEEWQKRIKEREAAKKNQ